MPPRTLFSALRSGLFLVFLSTAGWSQGTESLSPQSSSSNLLDDTSGFARSAAMGSAFAGMQGDATVLFDNPAGLASLDRIEVTTNSNLWLVDTFQETLLAGFPNGPGWGGLAVAGSYLDFGTFQGRDASGNITSNYSAGLLALKAGWGLEIFRGLSLGLGLQGVETSFAGQGSWAFAPDLGMLLELIPRLRIGAACDNIGLDPAQDMAGTILRLGGSYEASLDPADRLLMVAGGLWDPSTFNGLQAGLEYGLEGALFLRAGYQVPLENNPTGGLTGLTAGVGFQLSGWKLDYAFLPYGELGASHRLSLGYQFGPERTATPVPPPAMGPSSRPPALAPPLTEGVPQGGAVSSPPFCPGSALPPEDRGKAEEWGVIPVQAVTAPSPGGSQAPLDYSPGQAGPGGDKGPLVVEFDFLSQAASQGRSLERQGRCLEALKVYLEAVREDPQDSSVWQALGDLYYWYGDRKDAVYCFEQVVGLEPDRKDLARWLEKYKVLK